MGLLIRNVTFFALGAALVLSGCGNDPKAATEDNFKAALNAHFAKLKECVDVGSKPNDEGIIAEFRADGRGFAGTQEPTYVALAGAGLLEQVSYLKEEPVFSAAKTENIEYVGYKFSAKGKSYLRPTELDKRAFSTGKPKLCYGTSEVIDVTNFTVPADVMGVKASSVKFTYKIVDVADWATKPDVTNTFKGMTGRIAATSLENVEDMVLTNNGWVHHTEVK